MLAMLLLLLLTTGAMSRTIEVVPGIDSLHAALAAHRSALKLRNDDTATTTAFALGAGTHRLSHPLRLLRSDGALTFTSSAGGSATISGGSPIVSSAWSAAADGLWS
eukprot:COSAG01_NODE_47052_length_394_cov_0.844068_1_plen_106_part_01